MTVLYIQWGEGWGKVTTLGTWEKSEAPHRCLQPYLEPGMGIELIQEIHEEVNLEGANTQDHMFFRLCSVTAVVTPRLLPFHPEVDKLFKL